MSIEQGIKYQEEVWKQLSHSFKNFLDKLENYRETIFASQESDMYYLGYFLRAYLDKEVEFEDISLLLERGWQESEGNGNYVKEKDS